MKAWSLLLLIIPLSSAATIQGSVYNFAFEADEAIVEINTTPSQRMVAVPSYSFHVPKGRYEITATKMAGGAVEAGSVETLTVTEDGVFTLDIILFPEMSVEEGLEVEEPMVDPEELDYAEPVRKPWEALILLLVLAGAYAFHSTTGNKKLELDEDARKVYKFISGKKRTTQKEIRKEFNHSEAKISLIITELEEKNLVKKIKKGRGNVIIKT